MDTSIARTVDAYNLGRYLHLRLAAFEVTAGVRGREAQQLLAADPPDFSAAASACHRAHQARLQAEALRLVVQDAGL